MAEGTGELAGKRVVVMGLGHFGGGTGVTRYLAQQGAQVLVTDSAPAERLRSSIAKLADLPIEYRLGRHDLHDLTHADLIVVNPAIDPRRNRFLHAATAANIAQTSEIRLLVERLPNRLRTIGVTGTAGKSTVTAMIGHILRQMPATKSAVPPGVWIGGNLGGSLLEMLDRIQPDDWVVLELSSFMLQGLAEDKWSPHVAVVTNFSPNHLDWHETLDAYRRAKQVILDHQDPQRDVAILGPGILADFRPKVNNVRTHPAPAPLAAQLSLPLPGDHNLINGLVAADAVASALGVDWTAATTALADFRGLPHRLEFICERSDVRYFNDSKATTPEAAQRAIGSFASGRVHAILGGYDKRTDLRSLATFAAQHCRAIYTIGTTGDAIGDAAAGHAAELIRCESLNQAVAQADRRVQSGDVVLLSPGCASWDQFENYEARGERFTRLVRGTLESRL